MIRDSEGENDPELYRTGARLALLLFVRTHAPKYVRMGVCFWIWWLCNSDADKVLYDNFFYTKKTADGRYIWSDRFVEWFNKDIREYLGKYAKPNQELLVTRCAILMKERKRWKAAASNMRRDNRVASQSAEKTLAVSPIFCHQMDLIDRWNIWGDRSPLVGKDGETSVPKCFMDPSGQHALNIQLLFDISAAEDTLMEYFSKNHLEDSLDRVQRSEVGEHGVSLRKTPALVADIDQARDEEVSRRTSDDFELLIKLCNKPYLKDRINKLRATYPYLRCLAVPNSTAKKALLAVTLAQHHAAICERDENFVQKVEDRVSEGSVSCSGFSDMTKKKTELRHHFYALTDDTKQQLCDRKYHIAIPFEEQGGESESESVEGGQPSVHTMAPETPARRQPEALNEPTTPGLFASMLEDFEGMDI
jgi:hypothetical protein